MCGIIGCLKNNNNAVDDAISVLKRLEYRGYDSAGIAILDINGDLRIKKAVGKISNLESEIKQTKDFQSNIAIGHTRWATHGKVCVENSHPHYTDRVAVVHNGIIENYQEIKNDLESKGYVFKSQTDTEVVAMLITYYLDNGLNIKEAFQETISKIEGGYAFVVMFKGQRNFLAFAKFGSPLVIGKSVNNDIYISSDVNVLAEYAEDECYLQDGEFGFCDDDNIEIFDKNGKKEPVFQKITKEFGSYDMGKFETFMLKEIMEQPEVVGRIVSHYFDIKTNTFKFPQLDFDWKKVDELNIVACGTSYHAGLTASYYFEKYAGINVNCHIASEFKYRDFNFKKNGVFIFISQSGETADTISALKLAKENNQHIVSLVNTPHSNIDKLSDRSLYCYAGVETGVASTKAFTAQLSILIMLALNIGIEKNIIQQKQMDALIQALLSLTNDMAKVLKLKSDAEEIAKKIIDVRNIMVVGRNVSYGIALEGALKIKELTYIPTDALASGELKHGSIALIDDKTPVIAVAIPDHTFQKTCSNIEEILARGGKVIMISDKNGFDAFKDRVFDGVVLPDVDNFVAPLLYVIVLQFISYYMARRLGNDIDKPRNLAKSVTVE